MITLYPKDTNRPKGQIIKDMISFGDTFSPNFAIFDTAKGKSDVKHLIRIELYDTVSREILDTAYHWNLAQYKPQR